MKLSKLAVIIALGLSLMVSLPSFAGEEEGHACVHACQPGKFEMTHATGVIYCVNCALKAESGADVDCAVTGHKMALKTTKVVDFCGEEKADKVGMTLFFLDNDASKPLMKAVVGTEYTISGRLFENLPIMQVEEITIVAGHEKEEGGCCPDEGEKN